VEDNEWFFDTELLLLAQERGYRISEVPVDWIEDLDSRVEVASTALKDVNGLLRVRVQRLRRRLSIGLSRDVARPGRSPRGEMLKVSDVLVKTPADGPGDERRRDGHSGA
jgi:hypothetical protein